jgi:hypothetical protein
VKDKQRKKEEIIEDNIELLVSTKQILINSKIVNSTLKKII